MSANSHKIYRFDFSSDLNKKNEEFEVLSSSSFEVSSSSYHRSDKKEIDIVKNLLTTIGEEDIVQKLV